jgi:translation initiation factor IF-3
MQITAIIVRVLETQKISETFKARNLHVKTEEQYPQTLEIQFVQDKTSALDNFLPGEKVKVDINLRGREYTKDNKKTVFNTIQGWKIEKLS